MLYFDPSCQIPTDRLASIFNTYLGAERCRQNHANNNVVAPDDYVIATGEMHSVREFLDEVFGHLDLDCKRHVEIDPRYLRPAEIDALCGDAATAKLGWSAKTTFRELARKMADYDLVEQSR